MSEQLYYIEHLDSIIEDGKNDLNGWLETGYTSEIGEILRNVIYGKIPNLFKKTDMSENSIQLVHIHERSDSQWWYYPKYFISEAIPVLFEDDKEFII